MDQDVAQERLTKLRERLVREAQGGATDAEPGATPSLPDGGRDTGDEGQHEQLAEEAHALREGIGRRLEDVDAALERLAAGSYGVCTYCGEPIEPERLEVRPDAERHVRCEDTVDAGDSDATITPREH